MNTLNPSATPNRVSAAVSPVQWMHAFAYTPDPEARVRKTDYHYQHPELVAVDSEDRISRREDDVLPTRFYLRVAGSKITILDREPVPLVLTGDDGSDAYVSGFLTVPVKRKRSGRDGEAQSCSFLDGLTQRHTRKTRSRTRCTSATGRNRHDQGPSPSHEPPRPRSCRVVLDAVEIVSKKRSRGSTVDQRIVRAGCPIESAHMKASSHYPSPPVSRADRDVAVHDSHSGFHISHPVTVEHEGCSGSEPALPSKTSRYFARARAPSTGSLQKHFPVLTPPTSPTLTIPVYIESSDPEYPPLDFSSDETVGATVDESSIPTWYNNPGLFDDLMIMLRRLKPILVQGGWFRVLLLQL